MSMPPRLTDCGEQRVDAVHTFWQARASRALSREDAREIRRNISGFLGVLYRWSQNARTDQTRSPETSSASLCVDS